MQHLIALDPDALDRLEAKLDAVLDQLSDPPRWCRAGEAAERLGITESAVRKRAAQGTLKAEGTGKARRYWC